MLGFGIGSFLHIQEDTECKSWDSDKTPWDWTQLLGHCRRASQHFWALASSYLKWVYDDDSRWASGELNALAKSSLGSPADHSLPPLCHIIPVCAPEPAASAGPTRPALPTHAPAGPSPVQHTVTCHTVTVWSVVDSTYDSGPLRSRWGISKRFVCDFERKCWMYW